MSSLDLPTDETIRLLERHLPDTPVRILEVGAGEGRLAVALAARGHDVVALDSDPAAVKAARLRGADARYASWPEHDVHTTFDVVLFTRSLHHMESVGAALDAVREVLAPGGWIAVEDLAWEEVDAKSATLTARLVAYARGVGWEVDDDWPGLEDDALAHWLRQQRKHGLHTWSAQREGLMARFRTLQEAPGPYIYRYFAHYLASYPNGRAGVEAVLAFERALIEQGALGALGRFWVGENPS